MALTALNLTFCSAEERDFEPLVALISKVLLTGDSLHAEKYDFKKWWWKYFTMPGAQPQIYLCKEGENILGYYHCPVYFGTVKGEKKKFAMVQDVGVSEAARGKGVFKKLAEFATEQLMKSDVNMIYTFPNGNSIHTFLKYNGYSKIETFSTFILPIQTENIVASKIKFLNIHKLIGVSTDVIFDLKLPSLNSNYAIQLEEKLDEEMVSVFLSFNSQFKNSLTRNFDYLHWRYEEKPHGKSYFFTARREGKIKAVTIVSIEDLLGCKAAVVLDFATESIEAFAQLMAHLRKMSKRYFDIPLGMFFTSTSTTNNSFFDKCGFVKIPERINPRALHLLGKNITEEETEVLNPENWNFTLSEWDVL